MEKDFDFQLLFFLGKKTSLYNKFSASTVKIARELQISQQSVSRKLIELEKNGLIERNARVSGVTVSLKHSAVELLKQHYFEMQKIFSAQKTKKLFLKGKVVSGLGEGKYYLSMQQYAEQVKEKFGFAPYPGTLNIKVDVPGLERFLAVLVPIYVRGFETKERTFGGFTGYNVKINNIVDAALIIPDRTSHEKNEVELIAAPYLRRKFSLSDGNTVKVFPVVE